MDRPLRRTGPHLLWIALLVGGVLLPAINAGAQPTVGDVLCVRGTASRQGDRSLRFVAKSGIALRDRVSASGLKIDLRKPTGLCLPVGALDAAAFEAYGARITRTRPTQTKPAIANQRVVNRFGTDELHVRGIDDALVTSAVALDPPPAASTAPSAGGDLSCWQAERAAGVRNAPAAPAPLSLTTALGTLLVDVRAPTRLCFAADLESAAPNAPSQAGALVCYRAKLARTKPPQAKAFPREAATANRFGTEQLKLSALVDLCVPSDVSAVGSTPTPQRTAVPTPTPTLTPPPNFTLRVNPSAATVGVGQSAHFTATAVFDNGDTADFTERVRWDSSSPAAVASNTLGDRGRIDTIDGGAATISVYDEATGVTSSTTGEDALLTIEWTLERIELLPVAITRGEGESFRLRATGHFTGGFTRSIAERLVYASSNPSVGTPTNDPIPVEHSRVLAVAEGTTVLSATDPLSGITSTDSDDDVDFTVVPPLERCKILQTGPIVLGVDTEYQLTAHGFYPGGFERVVTQQVQWESDAPTIIDTPNVDGDRSRVRAVDPGEAHVTATDSVTGVVCEGSVTFQVGAPSGLALRYSAEFNAWRPKRVGKSWRLRAVQSFPPPLWYKYVTEKVEFISSDPTKVAAPNVKGDRGRVDAVGSGAALITAMDPVSGQTSQGLYVRSLDGLTRVEIPNRDDMPKKLFLNSFYVLRAIGHFADGPAPLEDADVTFVSDNPAAVEVFQSPPPFHTWLMHGIAFGVATISATDNATGISSDAFGESLRVGVKGPLVRIELLPKDTTARVGGVRQLTAIGHYEGGVTELITQYLDYTSSAPGVGSAPNNFGIRSAILGISAGTTSISAKDPVTGISTTTTGDDATVEVIGPIERIRVEPSNETRSVGRQFSFTAIGTDADGRELNLTQEVTWDSSDAGVAAATNPEGNRSRIDTKSEGETTISAFDALDGISSSTFGDDATLTVSGILESITLSAEHTTVTAGESVQVTATGHLVGGATINLTQQVDYSSSKPAVAKATNPPGDRSRIETLAPGTAVISAFDNGTGIGTTAGGTVTLTVTPP